MVSGASRRDSLVTLNFNLPRRGDSVVYAHLYFWGYIKWEKGTQNMGLSAEIHVCWRNFLTSTCLYQELQGSQLL